MILLPKLGIITIQEPVISPWRSQVGRGLLNATLVQKFARHHQRSEIRVAGEAQGPIQGQGEIGCKI